MSSLNLVVLISLIALLSCEPEEKPYYQGSLPENPVNLEAFNSEYDDYNSTAPTTGRLIPFCFSTNRLSEGGNFDIIYQPMNIEFDRSTGILEVYNEYSHWGIFKDEFEFLKNGLSKINTSGNKLGPYLLYNQNSSSLGYDYLLLYASDEYGTFNINFIWKKDGPDFSDTKPVDIINSEYNDLYPSFNSDFSRIYFCSDRNEEKFDIYYVELDLNAGTLTEVLSEDKDYEVFKDPVLSSMYDDKCPYIFGNILIFSSNRPGGFGGYDLYYSQLVNGQWSTPVNFGEKINTPHDEYRPIIFDEHVDNSRYMMVFSSDRPGGKGGFDLYFVGVEK
jgi:hypothetical protein